MQPTALHLGVLALTSPRLLLRSHRAARNLSKSAQAEGVIPLLHLCDTLQRSPAEPAGHDPLDEAQRLIRRARQSRVRKLHGLIARAYARLSPEARRQLRERAASDMPRLVTALSRTESELARQSAIDLAADALDPRLVPSILPLAESDEKDLAHAARRTIRDLAHHLAHLAPGSAPTELHGMLLAAADRFPEHRSPELMEAAILILDPITLRAHAEDRDATWLDGREEAVLMGLRAALSRATGAAGRERAWELMAIPSLRKAAIDRLVRLPEPGELESLLSRSHLALRPARTLSLRSRISRAQRPSLVPRSEEVDSLPTPARRGLARWLDAIGAEGDQLDGLLEPMLVEGDPHARFSAMRVAPATLARDFAFDPNRTIAASATLRLIHRFPDEVTPELRRTLRRSRHETVREYVRERTLLSRDTLRARRALTEDRTSALSALRNSLAADDEFEVQGALHTIRRLGVADELADALLDTLNRAMRRNDSPAWRIVSSVLTLIPELPDPSVAKLLAAARAHEDARVRANAVEAEPRRPRSRPGAMVEILKPALDDPHHRVRTSALRVLLREESAPEDSVDRLLRTLGDAEPAPRAAALWLVERSSMKLRAHAGRRFSDIAARIAEIARTSPEEAERARATRCARRMLAEMKD